MHRSFLVALAGFAHLVTSQTSPLDTPSSQMAGGDSFDGGSSGGSGSGGQSSSDPWQAAGLRPVDRQFPGGQEGNVSLASSTKSVPSCSQEQMDLLNATRQTATAMIDLVLNVAGNMTEVAFNKTIWDLYFANSNSSHVREIYQMMRDSPFEAHCSACETGLWYNDTIIPVGAFCAPLFFAAPKSDYDDMVCNTPTGSSSWGPWTRSQWVLQWLAESALTAHPPAPPPPVNEWTMESQHRSGLFYVPQDTVVSAGKYSFDYFKGLKRNEGEVVPFAYWAYAQELWAYNSTQCQNGSHPVTNHR